MESLTLPELKSSIAEIIMQINDKDTLNKIKAFISDFSVTVKSAKIENTIEEEEFDASELTFEEWNLQFIDSANLDDYLPEYAMTLKEFRLKIYNSERSPSYPISEFYEKLAAYV